MGAKAAKLKKLDVPAHNPLVNNDQIRLHYFGDREEANETQLRQENHFTLINKNGVVDDGKTLVGLKKRNHMGKIYFIRRKPKRYGGQPDIISDNSSNLSGVVKVGKDAESEISNSDNLEVPDPHFNESSNHIFDSQIMGEDQRMIDNENRSEMSMESGLHPEGQTNEEDGKILLSDRKMEDSPREQDLKVRDPEPEDLYEEEKPNQGIDIKVAENEETIHPKEEHKIVSDDESSDEENEIPAVANVPEKKKSIREISDDSSSEGNEIEAVADEPVRQPSNLNQQNKIVDDDSSSDGNEIAAVAHSPEASDNEKPAPIKKKRSKRKKRVRHNEIDSDEE